MFPPICKKLYDGEAGCLLNTLCCPFCGIFGLIWRSIRIYVFSCCTILFQRCMVGCLWRYLFCCFGWPYEDDTFFGIKALGKNQDDDGDETGEEIEKNTDWVRAKDLDGFKGKRPQLFEGDIEPSDLCQGAVGDCWLVAAFASASEFPDTIRNMFLTKEYNPRGLYKIRLYDPQLQKWKIVVVDDRIPCEKGTKVPRFMKPHGAELWAIILEKAYAKHCDSYAQLSGGFVLWGWLSMTGNNVFQLEHDKETGLWAREDMVVSSIKKTDDDNNKKKDKRACGFRLTDEKYNNDELWILLKKYDKQKALMSASIGKTQYGKSDGPAGEQMLEREGLVAGHAYSLISAVEVTENKLNGQTFRLVQIRNPWGTYEWKGNWSDKSPMWKKHPSIAKKLNFVDADDGTFWMDYEDFKRIYTRINICDRDATHDDVALDVNEDDGVCGIVKGFCWGCFKFYCCCRGIRNLYCAHRTTDKTLDTKEKCCFIC